MYVPPTKVHIVFHLQFLIRIDCLAFFVHGLYLEDCRKFCEIFYQSFCLKLGRKTDDTCLKFFYDFTGVLFLKQE